jgi:dihydrofolate reductase
VIVSIIAAMDDKGGIARQGQLPWHLPEELKLFKQTTTGHHLLMGRKTFETIGKPLPGRTIIVVTRQRDFLPEGCLVAHSLEDGIQLAQSRGEDEVFVCGGGEIYRQALPHCNRMYLTVIHTITNADMVFPTFDASAWAEINSRFYPADETNAFSFTRKTFHKKKLIKVDKP